MMIFAIDDEPKALRVLCRCVEAAAPGAGLRAFDSAFAALDAIRFGGLFPDIVFSDIEMPGLSGLEFAVALKKASPDTRVVFVTAFSQYALDAFQVRAQGYIMKPLTTALVRRELDELPAEPKPAPNRLRVQCFGYFEVFWRGEPLRFARRRTKEFLAYLVDRRGAFCAMEDVISALWGDVDDMKNAKHRVRNYISDLRETLKGIGMEDLEGDMAAVNAFRGEYMTNYSWAELTAGNLYFNTF